MSFEYKFITKSSFSNEILLKVFTCFEKQAISYIKNLEPNNTGFSRDYYFKPFLRKEWPEDFTLSLTSNELFLIFHSATGEQRTDIVEKVEKCLSSLGVTGAFEEL